MTYRIALRFDDGVTRIVPCAPGETVADAAYRARVNIPLDCRDGACGTCKSHCEGGSYVLGDHIEDALSAEEAAAGGVLTCQMRPSSDCVVRIAASAQACRIQAGSLSARIDWIARDCASTVAFSLKAEQPLAFLPGQYVRITVPGSSESRAYSFSSPPDRSELSFLIRDVPGGLMSGYMRERAVPGDTVALSGPYGSFYLRPVERPVLMLAGGTGLAPFLSMLHWLADHPPAFPVRLAYGVNRAIDLVETATLDQLRCRLPDFDYFTVVVDAAGAGAGVRQGYVTDHLDAADLHDGAVDVYVCGPPPMVEGVRRWIASTGVNPGGFHAEKFVAAVEPAA
ncbi:MAG: ring-hydroxylating dioxygenase ferredoxin reductase family protein [Pseudomonadota bacterium]|nr:ring-hydroxylating dioxygenase ferredoxin reductase family protein [Pseudomonadota bacterium]